MLLRCIKRKIDKFWLKKIKKKTKTIIFLPSTYYKKKFRLILKLIIKKKVDGSPEMKFKKQNEIKNK